MGHFTRECRSLRNQESGPRNQDSSRRPVNVEDTSSKKMVAIDEASFDWSYMADDEVPTNMALMPFLNQRIEFNKSEFYLGTYTKGLASVEEQLVFYKKNEVMFYDQIDVIKRDASFRDSKINALKLQIEKLKKEKEDNQIKINNFKNASKSLDKLIGSQISDNSRQGVGFASYNVVAPPATGLFAPLTVDLSKSGLEENFAPTAVLTKSGIVPISTARQSSSRAAAPVSATRPINTAAPKLLVNEHDGGYVAFEGGAKGSKITGKGTIRTSKLDFEDVYFIKELQFNLFSVLQMCDKKNSVLFTNIECFVLSPNFKLADESHVLLKVPRKNNMYSFNMKSIVPQNDLTYLLAKATNDESMLWHRRLGHINFKNINKLVKDNLVRGLPLKCFENDQTCVACLKGKQHKVSFKSKIQNSIS
uniref:Putative ribonuclease H-like domain-containing protein n=1 Tax=Tanacetum cinerariifolium TaxID=118510 RepID=A0A6L2LLF2_TANCI|nr:putative ribonuclease H-like domain-containing protein [Tanacetum cinerariifolium]